VSGLLRPWPAFFFTRTMMAACGKEAEARVARARKAGVDWSVGDEASHLQRQLTGIMGEHAVAVLLGVDPKGAVLGKEVGRRGTAGDGGEFDFAVPRLDGAKVEVKAKHRAVGLDRLPQNDPKHADVWVLAVRVPKGELEEGLHAVRIIGWVYGWEWAEKERAVTVGPAGQRTEALRIAVADLRPWEELERAAWPEFAEVPA
jgi:hypothetical protein